MLPTTNLLIGKKGLILGIANKHSIAYAIAQVLVQNGAEIAITYRGDSTAKRVIPLAEELNVKIVHQLNVSDVEELKHTSQIIEKEFGKLDFIIHSIAFADKDELQGRFLDTSLDNFLNSMNISCYSLVSVIKNMERLLVPNSSILTLSYYGAQKVVPNYNVMGVVKAALETSVKYLAHDLGGSGIRVNAISAGPIKTLAASAIGDFGSMLKIHEGTAPLKRNITLDDVAGAGLYFISDLSSGVTGEVHFVDGGYNIMGSFDISKSEA